MEKEKDGEVGGAAIQRWRRRRRPEAAAAEAETAAEVAWERQRCEGIP